MEGRSRRTTRCLTRTRACWPAAACLLLAFGCAHPPIGPGGAAPPAAVMDPADDGAHSIHATTYVRLGDLKVAAAGTGDKPATVQEELLDAARRAYEKALQIDPACAAASSGLGKLYQTRGDYDRAVEAYRTGLKGLPQADTLWFDLGMCQARHHEWQPAIDCLSKAKALNHDNAAYAKALGFCLCRAGRYDEGFDCMRQVLSEAQAHYNVARVLHATGDDAASRKHLQQALRLKPDLVLAQKLLAQLDMPPRPGQQAVAATPASQPTTAAAVTPSSAAAAVARVDLDKLDQDMLDDGPEPAAKIGASP